jgi:hypothetical protein
MLHEDLIFIVGSPRSGSTLLQRMVASHSQIHSHPEPHLITPLAYLGYYDTVDKAPFDHINAAAAFRELAQELPRGEEDYLDALRAYASTIYERVLQPTKKRFFADKTPEYATVLPFLQKLYPRARYIVLTRHPLAVLHSQAHSFFGGDYAAAHAQNPLLTKYVPAIGTFMLEKKVPFVHVRYEDVVAEPEREMRRIAEHLGIAFEPGMVEYGRQEHISKSYGDPESVQKHSRPVTDSLETWAADLKARPEALEMARELIGGLDPAHLQAWGYPADTMFAALEQHDGAVTHRSPLLNGYRLKRQVLLALRKNIHHNALGAAVKRVRYYCDVLLRT